MDINGLLVLGYWSSLSINVNKTPLGKKTEFICGNPSKRKVVPSPTWKTTNKINTSAGWSCWQWEFLLFDDRTIISNSVHGGSSVAMFDCLYQRANPKYYTKSHKHVIYPYKIRQIVLVHLLKYSPSGWPFPQCRDGDGPAPVPDQTQDRHQIREFPFRNSSR